MLVADLRDNLLTDVSEDTVLRSVSLQELHLEKNRLSASSLMKGFGQLPSLHSLYLDGNQFTDFFGLTHNDNSYLPGLCLLSLKATGLKRLTINSLRNVSSLRLLDLRQNQLASLTDLLAAAQAATSDREHRILAVRLGANPLTCSCQLLKQTISLPSAGVMLADDSNCRTSANRSANLRELVKEEIWCTKANSCVLGAKLDLRVENLTTDAVILRWKPYFTVKTQWTVRLKVKDTTKQTSHHQIRWQVSNGIGYFSLTSRCKACQLCVWLEQSISPTASYPQSCLMFCRLTYPSSMSTHASSKSESFLLSTTAIALCIGSVGGLFLVTIFLFLRSRCYKKKQPRHPQQQDHQQQPISSVSSMTSADSPDSFVWPTYEAPSACEGAYENPLCQESHRVASSGQLPNNNSASRTRVFVRRAPARLGSNRPAASGVESLEAAEAMDTVDNHYLPMTSQELTISS